MFDKRTSPPRCSNVAFIDTLLITPGGMGLAECGELLGLPKLTIPAPYSITNMREYLLGTEQGLKPMLCGMPRLRFVMLYRFAIFAPGS